MIRLIPHKGDPFQPGKPSKSRPSVSHGGLRLHLSKTKIGTMNRGTNARKAFHNATGLWYAFDAGWIHHQQVQNRTAVGRFAYDVQLGDCMRAATSRPEPDPDKVIMVILDLKDAFEFHERFGGGTSGFQWLDARTGCAGFEVRFQPPSDFSVLSQMQREVFGDKDFSEDIRDEQFDIMLQFTGSNTWMHWLHSMDIASGCIWNPHEVVSALHALPLLSSVLIQTPTNVDSKGYAIEGAIRNTSLIYGAQ